MNRLPIPYLITCFLLFFTRFMPLSAEENFILTNGLTNEIIYEQGLCINERVTPCSTFKVVLSLIGFDSLILKDEKNPTWPFHEDYDDYIESWKAPHNPQSWIKNGCLWYSKVLALQLGMEKIQHFLTTIEYGNQDMSDGLEKPAWISSSLKISPKEQTDFIQKMIQGKLPISSHAMQMTKGLLFIEELPDGWKLYGKTGLGPIEQHDKILELGWFIGWIEKDHSFFPFAYNIREEKIHRAQRIPRVKQLLMESKAF